MKANKNAQKGDEPMSAHIHIRCSWAEKQAWTAAAGKAKLSDWIREKLNKEANHERTQKTSEL